MRQETSTVPAGTRLVADESLRRYRDGKVVLGGSPLRLLRLSSSGGARLRRWLSGEPVGDDAPSRALARRLLDTGLVHPEPGHATHTPADVTLVVPVKDNAEGVRRLRAATMELGAQVVVDDGSAAPLLHATMRHPAPRGPAAARNTGWRAATTELVAFLDSDTHPEPGWLDTVLPLFGDPDVLAVAPRVVSDYQCSNTDNHSRPVAAYEAERSSLDMGTRPASVRPMSRVSYVPTAALVVRRAALSEAGGFDETLRYGEDVDLVWRLIAGGGVVRYQPSSVVRHEPRPTLRSWLRQRFDYGTSAAPLAARHPGRLACARLSRAAAVTWTLVALGQPRAGFGAALTSGTLLPRTLRRQGIPVLAAARLAAQSQLGAGAMLADATRRAWWPLALLSRRGRRALLAALVPCVVQAVSHRHDLDPVRWAALRVADDLAYGAGVWAGCLRHRTLAPLLPRLTERAGRSR
ncbi:MAG: mycofactocin system glycosyltransferase [Actinophytocola sp.]|nr:mycofactocin system glycosyltransferase [Actinophytocola sp.]